MATSSIIMPTLKAPIHRSNFLGQTHFLLTHPRSTFPVTIQHSSIHLRPSAKFDIWELMGGRGLCNGEIGIQQEINRNIETEPSMATSTTEQKSNEKTENLAVNVPENAFEKELMGLTGGFPGGEKGLRKFIEQNPPPKKEDLLETSGKENIPWISPSSKKPKAPELPLLMPGMIAIVKNPSNPFYMYCGIVQRITDGKAGVLFEGGNWDRLITFRLEELERREKGPPMKNPRSAILEPLIEQMQESSDSSQ